MEERNWASSTFLSSHSHLDGLLLCGLVQIDECERRKVTLFFWRTKRLFSPMSGPFHKEKRLRGPDKGKQKKSVHSVLFFFTYISLVPQIGAAEGGAGPGN
jgi:hypothetical protein